MQTKRSPPRSSTQGVICRTGWRPASARASASEAKRASRSRLRRVGKIALARPASISARTVARARPEGVDALRLVGAVQGAPAGRGLGQVEEGVEAAGLAEIGAPAGEGGEGVQLQRQAERVEQRREGPARRHRLAQGLGVGLRPKRGRHPGLLDRLADRRDPGGGVGMLREARGDRLVLGIDAAAGKDQGAGGEGHRLRPLEHQNLGWPAAGRRTHQDQGRGGDRLRQVFVVHHGER